MKSYRRPFPTLIGNVVVIVILILLAWFSHLRSEQIVPIIFWSLAVIIFIYFANEPLAFEVHSDQLLVRRIFGVKIYPFSQIKYISLDEIPTWGGTIPSIKIELSSGKKINLMAFHQLRNELYRDLLSAWKAS